MILINNELKALYIPMPKCGYSYVSAILKTYYNFKNFVVINRDDIFDFFDNDEHLINSIEYYKGVIQSIRKYGVVKFIINNEDNNIEQDMNKEKWDSYYKFTFIRNPYEKFISAYLFVKTFRFPDDSPQYYEDVNTFFDKSNEISNISYFHAFLSQTDHLLDYSNQINMQYIGNVDDIDNDLINILHHIGIKDITHLDYAESKNVYSYNNNNSNFFIHYDKKLLTNINKLFSKDLECFNFKKFKTISYFNKYFRNKSNNDNNESSDLYKHIKLSNINLQKSLSNLNSLNTSINEFFSNIETIYQIKDGNFSHTIQKKKIQTSIRNTISYINNSINKKLTDNLCNIISNNNNKFFIKNKNIKTCRICKQFTCFNKTAITAHTFFCKKNYNNLQNSILINQSN